MDESFLALAVEFVDPSFGVVSIVDDDLSFRMALAGLVRAFGFPVAPFASAAAFLESSAPATALCLICDVNMPGLGGFELCDRLAAFEARIPTIFVSAAADQRIRAAALARGALAFLDKPVDPDDLLSLIQSSTLIGKATPKRTAADTARVP
jgi:FixJ family two-component response regulator